MECAEFKTKNDVVEDVFEFCYINVMFSKLRNNITLSKFYEIFSNLK